MSKYGPLVALPRVADALEDLIARWERSYTAEAERQRGWNAGELPPIAAYFKRRVLEAIPGEDRLPACIIVVSGGDDIRRKGDGSHDIVMNVGLAIVGPGQDQDNARDVTGTYAAGIFAIPLHKQTFEDALDGRIKVQAIESATLDDLPPEDVRTRAIARAEFTVLLKDFVRSGVGPNLPDPPVDPTDPVGDWPQAQSVHVDVKKEGDS